MGAMPNGGSETGPFDDDSPRLTFPQSARPRAVHVQCSSCGLLLEELLGACPACGASIKPDIAHDGGAQCAKHAEFAAVATCPVCGRFCCSRCFKVDLSRCSECLDRQFTVEHEQLDWWEKLFMRTLAAQGALGLAVLSYLGSREGGSGALFIAVSFLGELVLAIRRLRSSQRRRRWPALLAVLNTGGFLVVLAHEGATFAPLLVPALACAPVAAVAWLKVHNLTNSLIRLARVSDDRIRGTNTSLSALNVHEAEAPRSEK